MKYLQLDNETRYVYHDLKQYCIANGIKMNKIILGRHRHNGAVNRMNKTLNEHARSIHIHPGLPKMF